FAARARFVATGDDISRDVWAQFAELGWLSAGLPEEYGGWGGGAVESSIIMQECGRHLVREPYLESAVQAVRVLLGSDNAKVRSATLSAMAAGTEIVVCAFSETAHGAADTPPLTEAAAGADGQLGISGRKSHVPWGARADRLLVSAR